MKLRKNILSGQIYSSSPSKEPNEKGSATKPIVKPLTVEPTHGDKIKKLENIACGTPELGLTQSLVIGGKAIARGQ